MALLWYALIAHLILCHLPLASADIGLHAHAETFVQSSVSFLNRRDSSPFPQPRLGVKQFTPYSPHEIIKNMSSVIDWSTNKVYLEVTTCLHDQVPQDTCEEVKIGPVYFPTEPDFAQVALDVCRYTMTRLSRHGSPYGDGFNSLVECVRWQQWERMKFIAKALLGQKNTAVNALLMPLVDLPPSPGCEVNWMWLLAAFEDKLHAQAGQDGVVEAIFGMVGTSADPYFVEVGYNRPHLADGSNTLHLHEQGWRGLLIDGEHQNHSINLHAHFVTHDNIAAIFDQHGVPEEPDYVSIDIDSIDVWVARSLLMSKYSPRVVSIEYNSHFPIGATIAMPPVAEDPTHNSWNGFDAYFGCSAGSVKLMAEEAGYEVVHFVGTHDMILVRRDLLGGECPPPYAMFANRLDTKHHCVIDAERRGHWVEYATWLSSGGDAARSRQAALDQVLPMKGVDASQRSSPKCLGLLK